MSQLAMYGIIHRYGQHKYQLKMSYTPESHAGTIPTVAVKVYLSIQFVNPSGNGVGLTSVTITLPAGGAQAIATGNVTFNQLGNWQLLARMVQA
jgi:hypothetical protein